MSSSGDITDPKPRERKQRRAEVQLYRPGALRQRREAAATNTSNEPADPVSQKKSDKQNAELHKQPKRQTAHHAEQRNVKNIDKVHNDQQIMSRTSNNYHHSREKNNNPTVISNKLESTDGATDGNSSSNKGVSLGKSYSRTRSSKQMVYKETLTKSLSGNHQEVSKPMKPLDDHEHRSYQFKKNEDVSDSRSPNNRQCSSHNSSVLYSANKYEKSDSDNDHHQRNSHPDQGKISNKKTIKNLSTNIENLSVQNSVKDNEDSKQLEHQDHHKHRSSQFKLKSEVLESRTSNASHKSRPNDQIKVYSRDQVNKQPSNCKKDFSEDGQKLGKNNHLNRSMKKSPSNAITKGQMSRSRLNSEDGAWEDTESSRSSRTTFRYSGSFSSELSCEEESQRDTRNSKHKVPLTKSCKIEPLMSRGIIHVPITSSALTQDTTEPSPTTKTLFNPYNPSKPTLVSSTHRGPHSGDSLLVPTSSSNTDRPPHPHAANPEKPAEEAKVDPSILYNIQKGEMDINYYVSSNQIHLEFERIMVIRQHLKDCYKKLVQSDIYLCQEKNTEAALWKSLYYMIIEKLREYISNLPKLRDASLKILCMIVDDGHEYFQQLISTLEETYEFSLETHISEDLTSQSYTKNRVRLAISMCQRFLLSLGDLARYRDQYNPNPNFSLSRKWYVMAQDVLPRNGRPFNQLAILATNLKRPLDVVYYYARSLKASNPFLSARDSLVAIFEDFRKMYESLNSGIKDGGPQHRRDTDIQGRRTENGNLRQEIWIRPDTGITDKRTLSESEPEEDPNNKVNDLAKLAPEVLMKQFLMCYLHCHGMLFSKVGLETFPDVLTKTLEIFRFLLKVVPSRLSSVHLLQIQAINMFAIENTQLKDCPEFESGYRSAAQDLALLLSQEMFGCLCEVTVALLPSNINYPYTEVPARSEPSSESLEDGVQDSSRLFLPQVAMLIPAIKVWCDWLLYNSTVWNPPAVSHELAAGTSDAWNKVAELATLVKGFSEPDVSIYESHCSQRFVRVILPEDRYLRGYNPLLSSQTEEAFTTQEAPMGRAEDWVRLSKMTLCLCQFLCGVEPPVLRLQKTDQGQILVPLVQTTSVEVITDSQTDVLEDDGTSDDGVISDDVDLEDIEVPSDDAVLGHNMVELIRRKRELERDLREQKKAMATVEGPITAQIEVRPRNLIPDTNCFIKYLDIIKRIVTGSQYFIMVPLAVMDELTKMSRDLAVEKYGDATHAMRVRESASASVDYLTSSLKQGTKNLKCITSQGSILTSSFFAYEMNDDEMTNDDRILSCCVHLCDGSNRTRPIAEGVRRVYREVVLLTDDRILRIKAYSRDVPVRSLLDFAKWAEIPIGNNIGP